jgi:hypothetical protein
VDIEKPGFKKYSRPDVVVQVNQTAHIDAAMQIGDVSQTVEVNGHPRPRVINVDGILLIRTLSRSLNRSAC